MFTRHRRLRINSSFKSMFQEIDLKAAHMIKPLFVHAEQKSIPLTKLPNSKILTITDLLFHIEFLLKIGIKAVNLYPCLANEQKDHLAQEALNPDGIIPQAISAIKKNFPECLVIPDVALDPYTSHGHDGILDDKGNILNDQSVTLMAAQSIIYADAGADMLAPSDMFDGRTFKIRQALDQAQHHYVGIISYAAKFASNYYSPFREVLAGKKNKNIDKSSYQLAPPNGRQALDKILTDLSEGADIILIKPAGHYLDIVAKTRELTHKPIAVFQVSGECAMLKLAAAQGLGDEKSMLLEQLLSMRRAGADLIFSYYAETLFSSNLL